MNEDKKDNIMETNVPLPPPPLTWRDGAIPVLAVALAWIFWACFDLERIDDYGLPHVGILILVCAHFAAVLTVLGRRARFDAGGLFCGGGPCPGGELRALQRRDVFGAQLLRDSAGSGHGHLLPGGP